MITEGAFISTAFSTALTPGRICSELAYLHSIAVFR